MPGPQVDYFAPTALDLLCDGEYTIESGSDRTGMRLEGPSIPHIRGYDIASDALAPGSIQIPGMQKPIVLLADRPTTGGYPKIATVISADLPGLGRTPIGSRIAFKVVAAGAAMAARREQMARMNGMKDHLVRLDIGFDELSSRLLNDNLVSGIFDACA
jgi:allophanate hydrolase subunit 2